MGDGAKEPPALSSSYRAAQRQFAIFAGLLIAWETIGLDLKPIPALGIEVTDPRGVPYVLLVLVIYSGIRMLAEWMQCDRERRKNPWAFLDFAMAWLIAAFGVTAYVARSLLEENNIVKILTYTFLLLLSSWWGITIYRATVITRDLRKAIRRILPILVFGYILPMAPFVILRPAARLLCGAIILIGLLGFILAWLMNRHLGDPFHLFVIDTSRSDATDRPSPPTTS